MKKKLLSAILCATTLFSAVGFSSCQVTDVLFADYKEQIAEMQETLNAQQEKIADFESDVAELQEAINEKEEQIAQLEQDKQALEEQMENLESELAKYESLIVEQEVNDMVEFDAWDMMVSVPQNGIIFHCSIEGVLFECVRDDLPWDKQGLYEYTVPAEKRFGWDDYIYIAAPSRKAYVDVYVKLGDNYIGYAVIEINVKDYQATPTLLKSVTFSKLLGEYPQVSKEEVKVLIDKVKNIPTEENGDKDGIVHWGDINLDTVYHSALISYKVQEVVSADVEYIPFEISMSNIGFNNLTYMEGMKSVTLTVGNLTKLTEPITLNTLEGKDFTADKYGYEKIKDEKGNDIIKYRNCVTYNVPTSLLSGEKGLLVIEMAEDYGNKNVARSYLGVRYEFEDGKIYFSAV